MNKDIINSNGYKYVDLKLPSGALWATCNVGASKPSDYGQYFQWGDTQGYTKDQIGTGEGQKKFASNWSDYKWNASEGFRKYNTTSATLELEDDAAHFYMGGDWHIPTPTQCQELLDNTTSAWTTLDDVNGRIFTSKTDTSKSIFIPAAGYAWEGSVHNSEDDSYVWSSMLNANGIYYGQVLSFSSSLVNLYSDYRFFGFSVRGVIG